MAPSIMLAQHGKSKSTVAVAAGKKRIHATFEDGVEMVEEYDISTDNLVSRRWKAGAAAGGILPSNSGKWEFEIGEPATITSGSNNQGSDIAPSTYLNPVFTSRDTTETWEWRIRNLPYPSEVYSLSIEKDNTEIVLRTSNKKYFKRFVIPSMVRRSLHLEKQSLDFSHSNNTLVITYDKPDVVLEFEQKARIARRKMNSKKDGDVECNQQ